jgi:hypothetical protein
MRNRRVFPLSSQLRLTLFSRVGVRPSGAGRLGQAMAVFTQTTSSPMLSNPA